MITQEDIINTEMKLEEASRKVEEITSRKNIPVFEVFVTIFSLMLAMLLFWYPSMLDTQIYSDGVVTYAYGFLLDLAPKWAYSTAFFVAAMLKAIGLLTSTSAFRIVGLIISVILYSLFSVCLAINFPSILLLLFVNLSIFTIISVPMVKSTSISTKPEKQHRSEEAIVSND